MREGEWRHHRKAHSFRTVTVLTQGRDLSAQRASLLGRLGAKRRAAAAPESAPSRLRRRASLERCDLDQGTRGSLDDVDKLGIDPQDLLGDQGALVADQRAEECGEFPASLLDVVQVRCLRLALCCARRRAALDRLQQSKGAVEGRCALAGEGVQIALPLVDECIDPSRVARESDVFSQMRKPFQADRIVERATRNGHGQLTSRVSFVAADEPTHAVIQRHHGILATVTRRHPWHRFGGVGQRGALGGCGMTGELRE